MSDKKTARLILEDGTLFKGYSFGAETSVPGRSRFQHSHDRLSRKSNRSVVQRPDPGDLPTRWSAITAFRSLPKRTGCSDSSNRTVSTSGVWSSPTTRSSTATGTRVESLGKWLADNGVPAICGVDTRQITKIIRERGVHARQGARMKERPSRQQFVDPNRENLVGAGQHETGRRLTVTVGTGSYWSTAAASTTSSAACATRDATVIRVPWDYDFTQLEYDGVMLSNGPGDPQQCGATIANIKKAIALGKPIFGICLGNQLLSIAAGATTFKLKYGHRSHNQPALMVGTNRAVITSQNHGFAVDTDTLDPELGTLLRKPQRRHERRHPAQTQAVLLGTVPPGGLGRSGRHRIPVRRLHPKHREMQNDRQGRESDPARVREHSRSARPESSTIRARRRSRRSRRRASTRC